MKINIYNPDNGKISGTLSSQELIIIDAEFSKVKPGDGMEIELLDKKGFIEEEKISDVLNEVAISDLKNKDLIINFIVEKLELEK